MLRQHGRLLCWIRLRGRTYHCFTATDDFTSTFYRKATFTDLQPRVCRRDFQVQQSKAQSDSEITKSDSGGSDQAGDEGEDGTEGEEEGDEDEGEGGQKKKRGKTETKAEKDGDEGEDGTEGEEEGDEDEGEEGQKKKRGKTEAKAEMDGDEGEDGTEGEEEGDEDDVLVDEEHEDKTETKEEERKGTKSDEPPGAKQGATGPEAEAEEVAESIFDGQLHSLDWLSAYHLLERDRPAEKLPNWTIQEGKGFTIECKEGKSICQFVVTYLNAKDPKWHFYLLPTALAAGFRGLDQVWVIKQGSLQYHGELPSTPGQVFRFVLSLEGVGTGKWRLFPMKGATRSSSACTTLILHMTGVMFFLACMLPK